MPASYRSGLVSERGMAVTATGTDAAAAAATASPTSDSDYAARCAAKMDRNGGVINNGYGYYDDILGMGHWEWCDTNEDCACVSFSNTVLQPAHANMHLVSRFALLGTRPNHHRLLDRVLPHRWYDRILVPFP